MYQPAHFRIDDRATLHALMRGHPLATVVVATDQGLVANHLPLLLDEARGVLRGHVARANSLWQLAPRGPVLAVFQGPQAYVSPSAYPSKQVHGKVVPTWNYAVVHAHGPLRCFDDAAALRELLDALTARHEAGRATPWRVDDAPADYVATMLRAIIGFEIAIERLEGKWKVSQNRDQADALGVARALTADGQADSADLIHRFRR